jgi:carbon-monoxide dehydrogenase large subunit
MATTKTASPEQYVGQRVPRLEDARYLRGRGKYVDDVRLPGMLHAAFLRSPCAHAKVTKIDAAAARAHEGVALVLTAEDVADIPAIATGLPREEVVANNRPVLPTEKVRFVGEPVACVIAVSRYIAEDAARLIEVEYEPLPAITNVEQALASDAPLLHDGTETNNFAHIEYENGDVDKAFAEADRVFTKRFHHGRFHAAPLEGRGLVADWDAGSQELTVWMSTQIPHLVRTLLCHAIGLTENQLRLIAPDVGGGFGLKLHLWPEDYLVASASKRLGRPVKWIEDRSEALAASLHAKEILCELEIATKADGTFVAMKGRYVGDSGAYAAYPFTPLVDPLCAAVMLPNVYKVDAVRFVVDAAFTNKCPSGAYRGVGWTSGQTAREVLVDEIAHELGMDPMELRLKNTIPDEPYESATGCKYDGGTYAGAQRKAMELVDYEAFRERQRTAREEGRYLGVGFSPFLEPGGWSGELAKRMGFPFDYLDAARVTVEPDGSVVATLGLHSHGQAHQTTMAQVVADKLGVPIESVKIVQGDTSQAAYGAGTFGSRGAVIGYGAISRASAEVADKVKQIAGHALEVAPEDIELSNGNAVVRGAPDKSMPMLMVGFTAYFGAFVGGSRPPGLDPTLTSTRSYDPPETYANGCCAAIVEVDVETGAVKVERIAIVDDCGTMLNPLVVDGQLIGAAAQGIGGALFEELPYDQDGNFLAASLLDYLYPTAMDIPAIEVGHLTTPSPVTEGGVKGCGEGGMVATPAAVVNAVADALSPLGVTVDRTPLDPNRVLGLIREARSG